MTYTKTNHTYTFDDFLTGFIATVVSLIGDTLMILVVIGCYRIPSMKSSFGILTINQSLAEIIPCTACIIVFFFGLTLNFQFVIDYSYIVGIISLIMLYIILFGYLMISFNRFCAIAFPFAYNKMFKERYLMKILVIGWLIPIAVGLYFTVYQQCSLQFVHTGWYFSEVKTQKCGSQLFTFVAAQMVPTGAIVLSDFSTLVLLIILKKRLYKSKSLEIKRRELNFARQVLVQGFVFSIRGIWYTNGKDLMPPMNEYWKIYWTTSFSTSLFHVFDPMIVFLCNMEFRYWIFGRNKKGQVAAAGRIFTSVS